MSQNAISKTPYCITERLINAAEGNVDNGFTILWSKCLYTKKITTVHRVIEKLFSSLKVAQKNESVILWIYKWVRE